MEQVMCSSFYFGNSVTLYANMKKRKINDHNEVYLKTVVCLYSSIRYFSTNMKLIFFVNNLKKLEQMSGGKYIKILEGLNVEVIEVLPEYVDPAKPWAGSMYIFDIIKYLVNEEENQESGNKGYFFFDTDVVFLNNFYRVISIVEKYDWAGYAQFCEFGRHNTWLEDFLGIDIEKGNEKALPYGGEFLYLNSKTLSTFFEKFLVEYSINKNLYVTEEHYFTAIFNSNQFLEKKSIEVNPFFKRVIRANKSFDDQYLWGIHFPGEKDYKLKYLFNSLEKNDFKFSPSKAKKILGVSSLVNIYDIKSIGKVMKGVFGIIRKKAGAA